jgi:hypothetical protein
MNSFKLLVAGGVTLCAACATPNAYVPPEIAPAAMDALAALDGIRANLGFLRCNASQTSAGFGAVDYSVPTATVATGAKIGLTCAPSTVLWTVSYRGFPAVSISSDNRQNIGGLYYVCARQSLTQGCQRYIYVPRDGPGVQAIVNGWAVLGRRVRPLDPADDPAFQQAVRNVPPDPELLRRAQIHAESALRAQKITEAAGIYRNALSESAQWAAGHFNLALIYGELELYPEAIVEMKRYLYLTPGAADARAATDKVYEWEAAEKL